MLNYFGKSLSLLKKKHKLLFFAVIFILIIAAFLETFSIIAILPAAKIITGEKDFLNDYQFLSTLYDHNFINNISNEKLLVLFILFVTLVFILKNIILTIITYLKEKYFFIIRAAIQEKMYQTYLFQNYNSLSQNNTSLFINNIINESALIIDLAIKNYINFFQEISVISVLVLFLFFLNPLVTIGSVFLLFSLFVIVYMPSRKFIKKYSLLRQTNEERRIQDLNETFGNFKYIKILSLENFFLKFFSPQNILINKSAFIMSFIAALPSRFFETIVILSTFFICYYLYLQGKAIEEIIAVLLAYTLCGIRMIPSLNKLFVSIQSVKFSYPAIDKVYDDLMKQNNINNDNQLSNTNRIDLDTLSIKINNFSYTDEKDIFLKTEINLMKKDKIFIEGPSGSGKTTLINLITGLQEGNNISIFLNDKLIKKENKMYKIINFGYVPQEIFLSNATIKNNIILNNEYKKEKFKKIIDICDLEKFINNQDEKENTVISERASNISGGQKQRIALARALMSNPQVLILDEATNGLDDLTEERVINGIISNYPNTLIIAISHKNSLKRFFNKVCKIHDKKILLKNNI